MSAINLIKIERNNSILSYTQELWEYFYSVKQSKFLSKFFGLTEKRISMIR